MLFISWIRVSTSWDRTRTDVVLYLLFLIDPSYLSIYCYFFSSLSLFHFYLSYFLPFYLRTFLYSYFSFTLFPFVLTFLYSHFPSFSFFFILIFLHSYSLYYFKLILVSFLLFFFFLMTLAAKQHPHLFSETIEQMCIGQFVDVLTAPRTAMLCDVLSGWLFLHHTTYLSPLLIGEDHYTLLTFKLICF